MTHVAAEAVAAAKEIQTAVGRDNSRFKYQLRWAYL